MPRIHLHDKYFVPYIPNKKIEAAIDKVAEKINRDFKNTNDIPIFVCVLNGSMMFTASLMQRINFNCELDCIRRTSYDGLSSTGTVSETLGLARSIRNRTVIVVEDIVDTGTTLVDLAQAMVEAGAREVRYCTLLLKPAVYHQPIDIDYVAMEVEDKFIVGYGLDYDQLGRNLKDIYILD